MMEKCRDCGTQVSTSAPVCPKCGCTQPSLKRHPYVYTAFLMLGLMFTMYACLITGDADPEFEREVYELGREWLENREAGR